MFDEEPQETNILRDLFRRLKSSSKAAVLAIVGGLVTMQLLVYLLARINSSPQDVHLALSLFFLMFQRPVFCCAIALAIMPFVLRNSLVMPISNLLSHNFWFMFARLTYGAYLSNQIFMMFRVFNSERGIWACEIDAFLYFLAYFTLSFVFSFIVTLMVEMPVVNAYKIFVLGQKVHTDHLYDHPEITAAAGKAEIGRKYEHLIKSKHSNSNSNSTGSDGAESLDLAASEAQHALEKKHQVIPQKPRKQFGTFSEPLRPKKEE